MITNKLHSFVIVMTKSVCSATKRIFDIGDRLSVTTYSDCQGPNFNGATFDIDGYPYRKFFWHDEFMIVKRK